MIDRAAPVNALPQHALRHFPGYMHGISPNPFPKGEKIESSAYDLDNKYFAHHSGLSVGGNSAPQLVTAGLNRRKGPLRHPAGSEFNLVDFVGEG